MATAGFGVAVPVFGVLGRLGVGVSFAIQNGSSGVCVRLALSF